MSITVVQNDTHWKSSDLLRLVRAAAATAGHMKDIEICVMWDSRTDWETHPVDSLGDRIFIYLPKRGPKVQHPNALVALAAAKIPSTTQMLAVSESFYLANSIYYSLATIVGKSPNPQLRWSNNPPTWWTGDPLVITKYADPAKDGTYQVFLDKNQQEQEAIMARINKWQAEKARAEKNLKRAQRDLRKAKASLRAAKTRRGIK